MPDHIKEVMMVLRSLLSTSIRKVLFEISHEILLTLLPGAVDSLAIGRARHCTIVDHTVFATSDSD